MRSRVACQMPLKRRPGLRMRNRCSCWRVRSQGSWSRERGVTVEPACHLSAIVVRAAHESRPSSAPRVERAGSGMPRPHSDGAAEGAVRLARSVVRGLDDRFYSTWSKINVSGTRSALQAAYLLRVSATAFTAPRRPGRRRRSSTAEDRPNPNRGLVAGRDGQAPRIPSYLDATYDTVTRRRLHRLRRSRFGDPGPACDSGR